MKSMILLLLGIWVGMVLGISFLEAPLKFTAPNITTELGLGIGKVVFGMLNKIEIGFSIILLIWLIKEYKNLEFSTTLGIIFLLVLFAVQCFWLMPIMTERLDKILEGIPVAKSNHHFYYVGLEVLKVILLVFGFLKIYHYE